MVDLVYCLSSLLFFNFSLLYYYIDLNSSILFCFCSRDIYLFLGISVPLSTASEIFCGYFFETFVILLVILLSINSPITSAVSRIAFLRHFELHLWLIVKHGQKVFDGIDGLGFCFYFYQNI